MWRYGNGQLVVGDRFTSSHTIDQSVINRGSYSEYVISQQILSEIAL